MSYSLHAHAGAKVAEPSDIPSPASTVPGTDEDAAQMARLSYQASKMVTPQDKIRKAPATPQNPPLPRRIQSVELLSTQSLDSQHVGGATLPAPEPSENGQPKTSAKHAVASKKAKSALTCKKSKKVRKSAKSKHHPSKTKKITPKSKAQAPMQPENAQPRKASEKTPSPAPASACLPMPPPQTAQMDDASLPKTAQAASAIPPAIPAETKQTAPAAVKDEEPEPGKSPQPESVRHMLNRTQTTESLDLMAMTEALRETVKSALSSVGSTDSSPKTDELPKKVAGRSKETHARRMRFYRSLDSLLDQVGFMGQRPSAQELKD